jgi:uncharacterized membrane protein YccC
VTYREGMGRLILILLAALIVFLVISAVISVLHFLFWFAVVALVVVGALHLSRGRRRAARR